jgi:hypothetical protein
MRVDDTHGVTRLGAVRMTCIILRASDAFVNDFALNLCQAKSLWHARAWAMLAVRNHGMLPFRRLENEDDDLSRGPL